MSSEVFLSIQFLVKVSEELMVFYKYAIKSPVGYIVLDFLFLFLFERYGRERGEVYVVSLTGCPQWPGLRQAEAGVSVLNLNLPEGGRNLLT